MRMGRASESVRFLDDIDFTLSLDSRTSSAQQMTNIEIAFKPIVFRASYRDINLITSIVNKAVEMYAISQENREANIAIQASAIHEPASALSKADSALKGKAHVRMSKEQVKNIHMYLPRVL